MKSDLTSVSAGFYRACYEHLDAGKGIPSNLASAALLVQAITAMLSRWQAGKHGDRYGHARLLIPALAVVPVAWRERKAVASLARPV